STFHEPLVLFGYLAGIVSMEVVTGIIILPQRQTVLVAKQAAEVDVLNRGRFRFGVGLGWNPVEYEALGQSFSDRGRRMVEQAARQAGRDPASMGMEGRVSWGERGAETLMHHVQKWRGAGATHVSVNTMGAGLASVDDHLAALASAAGALELSAA